MLCTIILNKDAQLKKKPSSLATRVSSDGLIIEVLFTCPHSSVVMRYTELIVVGSGKSLGRVVNPFEQTNEINI